MEIQFIINNWLNRHNMIVALAESGYDVHVIEKQKNKYTGGTDFIVCVSMRDLNETDTNLLSSLKE